MESIFQNWDSLKLRSVVGLEPALLPHHDDVDCEQLMGDINIELGSSNNNQNNNNSAQQFFSLEDSFKTALNFTPRSPAGIPLLYDPIPISTESDTIAASSKILDGILKSSAISTISANNISSSGTFQSQNNNVNDNTASTCSRSSHSPPLTFTTNCEIDSTLQKRQEADELANRATMLARDSKITQAIDLLTQAIRLNPSCVGYYYNRAICFYRLDQFSNSLNDANLTLQFEPTSPRYLYRKALALYRLKRYTETSQTLVALFEIEPDHLQARQLLSELEEKLKPTATHKTADDPIVGIIISNLPKIVRSETVRDLLGSRGILVEHPIFFIISENNGDDTTSAVIYLPDSNVALLSYQLLNNYPFGLKSLRVDILRKSIYKDLKLSTEPQSISSLSSYGNQSDDDGGNSPGLEETKPQQLQQQLQKQQQKAWQDFGNDLLHQIECQQHFRLQNESSLPPNTNGSFSFGWNPLDDGSVQSSPRAESPRSLKQNLSAPEQRQMQRSPLASESNLTAKSSEATDVKEPESGKSSTAPMTPPPSQTNPKTVFIGNIPIDSEVRNLENLITERLNFRRVQSFQVAKKPDWDYAFVNCILASDAKLIHDALQKARFSGCILDVHFYDAQQKPAPSTNGSSTEVLIATKPKPPANNTSTNVFVTSLPQSLDFHEFWVELYPIVAEACGSDFAVYRQAQWKHCFLNFPSAEKAAAAFQCLHGLEIADSVLVANMAEGRAKFNATAQFSNYREYSYSLKKPSTLIRVDNIDGALSNAEVKNKFPEAKEFWRDYPSAYFRYAEEKTAKQVVEWYQGRIIRNAPIVICYVHKK